MMKILVLGKKGQLASELQMLVKQEQINQYVFTDRRMLDLLDVVNIQNKLSEYSPDIIVNTAAYTAVDLAENNKETSDKINHLAVKEIADWVDKHNKKFIQISTDYVFSGGQKVPYQVTDIPAPMNWYGQTKFLGEQAIINSKAKQTKIIRTSWLYSSFGHNFVLTMIRLMNERDQLNVVNDQIGSPTYAKNLAQFILELINSDHWETEIIHYTNKAKISWYDFALKIKEICSLNCKLTPVTTDEFPTLAKRTKYSVLDTLKTEKISNIYDWEVSLKEMLKLVLKEKK